MATDENDPNIYRPKLLEGAENLSQLADPETERANDTVPLPPPAPRRNAMHIMDRIFDKYLLGHPDAIGPDVIGTAFVSAAVLLEQLLGRPSAVIAANDPDEHPKLDKIAKKLSIPAHHCDTFRTIMSMCFDRIALTESVEVHPPLQVNGNIVHVMTYRLAPGGVPLGTAIMASTEPFTDEQRELARDYLGLSDSHLGWASAMMLKNAQITELNAEITGQRAIIASLEERIRQLEQGIVPTKSQPLMTAEPAIKEPAPSSNTRKPDMTIIMSRPKSERDPLTGNQKSIITHASDPAFIWEIAQTVANRYRVGNNRIQLFAHEIPVEEEAIATLLNSIVAMTKAYSTALTTRTRQMYELSHTTGAEEVDIKRLLDRNEANKHPVARLLSLYRTCSYAPLLIPLGFREVSPRSTSVVDFNQVTEAMTRNSEFRAQFPRNHIVHIVAKAMNDLRSSPSQFSQHVRALPEEFYSAGTDNPAVRQAAELIAAVSDLNEMVVLFGMREAEIRLDRRFSSTLPDQVRDIMDWNATYSGLPRRCMLLRHTTTPSLDRINVNLGNYAGQFTLGNAPHFAEYLNKVQQHRRGKGTTPADTFLNPPLPGATHGA